MGKAVSKVLSGKLALDKHAKLYSAPVFGGCLVVALALLALLWRLSSLTLGRASQAELATKHTLYLNSPWWKSISHFYGPYYLLLHLIFKLGHSLFVFRLTAVITVLFATLALYLLVTVWHGYKIGILTSIVFITNLGVLTLGRQETAQVSQILLSLGLVWAVVLLYRFNNFWSLLSLVIVAALSLYIPGAIYLVLAAVLLASKAIIHGLKKLKLTQKLFLGLVKIALLAPLVYRLAWHYSARRLARWLGYGLVGRVHAAKSFALNLARVPLDLFFRSNHLSQGLSLGHLPLMPFAETAIAFFGAYCYLSRFSNYRWRTMVTLFIIGWLSVAFGVLSVYALLPLVVISVGTGLAYLLREWYAIFPRNPVARYWGLGLMILVVLFTCFYSARSYFIAWANNPATVHIFDRKL